MSRRSENGYLSAAKGAERKAGERKRGEEIQRGPREKKSAVNEDGAGAAAGSALTTGGAATCGSTVGGMEDDGLVRFFDNKFQMKSS